MYLRNTMGQPRLNSLSVISIDRDLINNYSVIACCYVDLRLLQSTPLTEFSEICSDYH